MTAKKLIKELKKYKPDTEVYIIYDEGDSKVRKVKCYKLKNGKPEIYLSDSKDD